MKNKDYFIASTKKSNVDSTINATRSDARQMCQQRFFIKNTLNC